MPFTWKKRLTTCQSAGVSATTCLKSMTRTILAKENTSVIEDSNLAGTLCETDTSEKGKSARIKPKPQVIEAPNENFYTNEDTTLNTDNWNWVE